MKDDITLFHSYRVLNETTELRYTGREKRKKGKNFLLFFLTCPFWIIKIEMAATRKTAKTIEGRKRLFSTQKKCLCQKYYKGCLKN